MRESWIRDVEIMYRPGSMCNDLRLPDAGSTTSLQAQGPSRNGGDEECVIFRCCRCVRSTGIPPLTSRRSFIAKTRCRLWIRGLDCEAFGPLSPNVTAVSVRVSKAGQASKSEVGASCTSNIPAERRLETTTVF